MIFIFFLIIITWSMYKLYTFRNLPNGPWGLPVFGYLPFLNKRAPHITLSELSKKYGPVYSIQLGSVLTIVVTDTKLLKTLFSKDEFSGRAPLYVTHGIMKGYGIVCADGNLWKDQRKLAIHCLKNFSVSNIFDILNENINNLLINIEHDLLNKNVDFFPILRHHFGNVISYLIFGQKWSLNDKTWLYLHHLQDEGLKLIGIAGPLNFLPFLRFLPNFQKTMNFLLNGKYETHRIFDKFIQEELLNPKHGFKSAIRCFLQERNKTMSDKHFYSNEQFYHFLADLFGAALDTTLATLTWTLVFLMKYPEVQNKCYNEIKQEYHTITDFEKLIYMQAIFSEVQRIRTIVPLGMPHGTRCDTNIFQYKIPKNSMIIPLQWHIHMSTEFWERPTEFCPERFLDSNGKFTKNDNFMPFQFGKRMCIGEHLAKLLLFSFTAEILQSYQIISPDPNQIDLEGEMGIFFTPKRNQMIFRQRITSNGLRV